MSAKIGGFVQSDRQTSLPPSGASLSVGGNFATLFCRCGWGEYSIPAKSISLSFFLCSANSIPDIYLPDAMRATSARVPLAACDILTHDETPPPSDRRRRRKKKKQSNIPKIPRRLPSLVFLFPYRSSRRLPNSNSLRATRSLACSI